ncbi:MAG: SEC-C metal-binding domain-containing protein [Reinekea sp.]
MFDPQTLLARMLLKAVIHESLDEFVDGATPLLLDSPQLGLPSQSKKEAQLFLMLLFSSLPRSGNGYDFSTQRMPGRNDPCICGSGKKFKKCCVELVDAQPMPAEVAFQMALSELDADSAMALADKEGWTLKALTYVVPYLMELQLPHLVLKLAEPFLQDMSRLRNEHQELVSTLLDAMFELQTDVGRVQLLNRLCDLKKANSLQSIGHQRLGREYGEYYPGSEIFEEIRKEGSRIFSHLFEENIDNEVAVKKAQTLLALLEEENSESLYQFRLTDDEVSLGFLRGRKKLVKAWFEEWKAFQDSVVAEYPQYLKVDRLPEYWYVEGNAWLQMLQDNPVLLNSFDVMNALTGMIGAIPGEFDEDGNDVLTVFDKVAFAFLKHRHRLIVTVVEFMEADHRKFPMRLKSNREFWYSVADVALNMKSYQDYEESLIVMLERVLKLDDEANPYLTELLALEYFAKRAGQKIIELTLARKKVTPACALLDACARQEQGDLNKALERLQWLYKHAPKDLALVREALEQNEPLLALSTGMMPLLIQLNQSSHQDYRRWLMTHLPREA